MSDGIMIILIFGGILIIPIITVLIVLLVIQSSRKKKNQSYKGVAQGRVLKIVDKGIDFPYVIHVGYQVNGVNYTIKETAKLKSELIKFGNVPIGQKKTFVMGPIKAGDCVKVLYDEKNPAKAIIYGNEGIMNA